MFGLIFNNIIFKYNVNTYQRDLKMYGNMNASGVNR